jgi:serine protease Do
MTFRRLTRRLIRPAAARGCHCWLAQQCCFQRRVALPDKPAVAPVLGSIWPSIIGIVAAMLLALGPWHAAMATDEAAKPLETLEQQAFQAAVQRVAPSVVRIETVGGLEQVGEKRVAAGSTTGTIVAADGYIVSSAFSFLNRPDSILVQLPDGSRKPARLVAIDHNRLLALLKIEPEQPLATAEFAPESETRVGQWTIAVGRTFEGNHPNMAVGIVSAVRRIWGKALQTDAAVSPGNYGGPLVDIRGRVLGILTPLSPESDDELAGYEWYNSGIGFAIPIQDVQAILPRLQEGKDLRTGLLGISFGQNPSNFEPPTIAALHPNAPASQAGLKVGDRVIAAAGHPVERLADLRAEVARRYAGDRLPLVVTRDGKRIEVEIELAAELTPVQP